ncbi:Aste57867_692 [Aphanomyces stellatus]|uniref:Aste57867_692 protein n=1 Tax=Aphanomyces stellatus TaxID=120398 RepID=A0A485K3K6_9STRA|nr:hypothetical protein As57867_000691 [Aphanomyces stellatus]VFT77917.1 Aste57867_692 [Aphanomyces stellatus]
MLRFRRLGPRIVTIAFVSAYLDNLGSMLQDTVTLAIVFIVGIVHADYHNIKKIVNFGDSTSDIGNGAAVLTRDNGPVIPSDAYYKGRFSNGPTYIEHVAASLNVNLTSFSVGGATTADDILQGWLGGKFGEPLRSNGQPIKVPGQDTQIAFYLNQTEPLDKSRILYTMWIGGNDDSDNALLKLGIAASTFADAQYDQWVALAEAGAKNILTIVPPPKTKFAAAYGARMHWNAIEFKWRYWGVKLGLFEMPALMAGIVIAPSSYGFKYAMSDYCCKGNCFSGLKGNASVCSNPSDFALWDIVGHPSAKTHELIGKEVVKFIKFWF